MATRKDTRPGFRPLYQQVKEIMTERLIDGSWRPGELLPSEFQLADELGVSQGTVRKALDELTAGNLLVRRQGRGTFVAQHDQDHALFHFFKITDGSGRAVTPESRVLRKSQGQAKRDEVEKLDLKMNDRVLRITRVRALAGIPAILERIILPEALFPGLNKIEALPNTLYSLFAKDYGITVGRAVEHLRAVAADADAAKQLHLTEAQPLLEIDRIALALDGAPVEWRVSLCHTEDFGYSVTLA